MDKPVSFLRKFKAAFKIAVFLFVFLLGNIAHAQADTIYANSSTGDDSTGDGSEGSPYKTFTQAYSTASSGDTINLTGTFDWINGGETTSERYGFTIEKDLTIQGQGADQTFIQGNSSLTSATNRRVFTISAGYTVDMNDVTVRYGYLANYTGGGAEVRGTLTLDGCNVSYNFSGDSGGGIEVYDGTLTVRNSLIDHNTAKYQGGGIHTGYYVNGTGTADIINSTVAFNEITYTVATIGGGGIAYRGSGGTITNSTIAYNNMADGTADGAGLYIYSRLADSVYVKNSIIAGNLNGGVALGNYDYDIEVDAGAFVDNGNNIIGKMDSGVTLADSSFIDAHSYNGADEVFSSVDYGSGSLYLNSTLAENSSVNGTQTLAITNSASVAVDHGGTSSNQSFIIPTIDQREFYRTAIPDIGAYEYDGTFAPPTYTLTYSAGSNGSISGDSPQTVSGGDDGTAVTAVPDSGYRFFNWSDSSTDNPRTDTSVSGDITVTANFQDATGPVISNLVATPTENSAEIAWNTDENADSEVAYGLTSSFGASESSSTSETDHSLTLGSLNSCATYYYQVSSEDSEGNSTTSSVATFHTSGCSVANISSGTGGSVGTSGGSVSLNVEDGEASLDAPENYLSQATTIQINKLDQSSVPSSPSGLSLAKDNFFEFLAVLGNGSLYESEFDEPITLIISYGSDTEDEYDESTLDVYKYVSGNWEAKNCILDTEANTLTCSLSSFSTYGVLGEEIEDEETEEEYDVEVEDVEYSVGQNSITVEWETEDNADSRIRYGFSSTTMDFKKKDNKDEKKHKITIKDLLPNTKYFFRVYSDREDNRDYSKIYSAKTLSEESAKENSGVSETLALGYDGDVTANVCSYTVQEGDYLWSIAKNVYGDATAYPLIVDGNKNKYPQIVLGKLSIGQTLSFNCKKEEELKDGIVSGAQDFRDEKEESLKQEVTQEPEKETASWWNPLSWF